MYGIDDRIKLSWPCRKRDSRAINNIPIEAVLSCLEEMALHKYQSSAYLSTFVFRSHLLVWSSLEANINCLLAFRVLHDALTTIERERENRRQVDKYDIRRQCVNKFARNGNSGGVRLLYVIPIACRPRHYIKILSRQTRSIFRTFDLALYNNSGMNARSGKSFVLSGSFM